MTDDSQPAPKARSKGWRTVLGVIGALALFCCLGLGGVAFSLSQNAEVQKALLLRAQQRNALLEAMGAPGAKAVKALGCKQALVLEAGRPVPDLVGEFVDAGQAFEEVTVICRADPAAPLPACDLIAQTYVQAATPQTGFLVTALGETERCQVRYDAAGGRVK